MKAVAAMFLFLASFFVCFLLTMSFTKGKYIELSMCWGSDPWLLWPFVFVNVTTFLVCSVGVPTLFLYAIGKRGDWGKVRHLPKHDILLWVVVIAMGGLDCLFEVISLYYAMPGYVVSAKIMMVGVSLFAFVSSWNNRLVYTAIWRGFVLASDQHLWREESGA
mgnify:CR=1 FL=1